MPEEFWNTFAVYFVLFGGLGVLWLLRRHKKQASTAQEFFRDLTELAREKKIDPVVGREEEIDRIIHVIARRTKNNPLLIGAPGVGKTAIVEGLAHRIASGDVPDVLKDKRLLELNLSELISGTKYRGEFEGRLRAVTKELESAPRRTILFIDEIHIVEQTKGVEGALSAADILKPALARGDLPVIGATTFAEYEKYIRAEPALDRRFQPVYVAEPTPEAALLVLRGVKPLYEEHHGVAITDEALEAAVDLSKKLKGRHLPDKAIDLMDEACAKVSVEAAGIHRLRLGLMHGAAKQAKARAKASAPAWDAAHKASAKAMRTDLELKEANRLLSARLKKSGQKLKRGETCPPSMPCVTAVDVEAVIDEWAELSRREA